MSGDNNKKIAIGAVWMIALRQMDRFIGLISITVLARLLLPEAFGLVVYATSLVAIIELFFRFGFETVLIRDKHAGRENYDTAWTLKIIVGAALCLLLLVAAIPAAAFFEEPRVTIIVCCLAVAPLIRGFENIGIVDFQKDLEFDREFRFKISVRLLSTIATIVFAFWLRSHWALVIGMLLNSILATLLSFVVSPFRPRLTLANYQRIFGFSKWILVQNIVDGLTQKSPIFFLGRLFDAPVAAFYNMSNELSNMATGEIAAPIRRALFPGIMAISDDTAKVVDTIISAIGVIAFIGLPVAVGLGITAPVFVPILLGDRWDAIIPLMQILAINGAVMALYSNSHVVYYALDRPHVSAFVTATRLFLLVPAFVYAVPQFGAIGAAWAWTIVNVFVTVTEYLLFYRMMRYRPALVLDMVWRSVVSVVLMGLTVQYQLDWLASSSDRLPAFVELLLLVATGAVSYALSVFGLWLLTGRRRGAESFIIDIIAGRRKSASKA